MKPVTSRLPGPFTSGRANSTFTRCNRTLAPCCCMLILSFSATFVLSTPKVWTSGSGNWLNATGWNGTPPGPKDAVSIEGSANVTISSEAMASTIDVGSFHNSHATLLMTGGSLVLSGILRAGEMTDCSGTFLLKGGDCISVYGCDSFILDHCSTHWGTDETLSVTGNSDRYTVQWTLIGEGLEYAGHSMGSLLGGGRCTWSHNLWAHCRTRNPRFGLPVRCEFRNNVIYNWGDTAGYGEFARPDYVGNFLRPGPSTTQKPGRFLTGDSFALPGSLFLSGNTIDGCSEIGTDNWLGTGCDKTYAATQPFGPSANRSLPVSDALNAVLSGVGATVPHRDAADARLVADVQNRTGKIIRSQEEVGGHPTYPFVRSTVVDSDQDGIPDDWEKSHGLNPNNATDTNLLQPDGYTNLEGYLNSLTFFSR